MMSEIWISNVLKIPLSWPVLELSVQSDLPLNLVVFGLTELMEAETNSVICQAGVASVQQRSV